MNRVVAALLGSIMGVMLIFTEPGLAKKNPTSTDQMFARINKVWSTYEKGQYKKARKDLDRIIAEIEADPSHGDHYPNSVFYALKDVDVHINDKLGIYRLYPKFVGKITEIHLSARGGMIAVKKGKIEKSFLFDTGTILKGKFDKGSRVLVYYEDNIENHAVKIITSRKKRR
jgi:hypothetical protein